LYLLLHFTYTIAMPPSLPPKIPKGSALLFFFLALIPAWGLMAWMHRSGWDLGWNQTGLTALALMALGTLPGIGAWIAAVAGAQKLKPALGWRVGRPAYLIAAWFLLPFLGMLAAALSVLFKQTEWDLSMLALAHDLAMRWPEAGFQPGFMAPKAWGVSLFFLLADPWLLLFPAWLEETGWRGFGYAWLRPRGFWVTVAALGLLSWLWRAPLLWWGFPYPGHTWLALGMGLGFQLGLSLVCTWLREASGGVLAPALARATVFGAAALPMSLTANYDPAWTHLQGLPGIALLGLLALLGWWADLFPPRATPGKGLL
jgi:hypothetical protein